MSRDIAVPADIMWELLVDVRRWPEWGPSVRHATLATSRLELASTGTVRTVIGLELPFEVTGFEEGRSWAWSVAGCPATDHVVEARGPEASWVAFGVPWIARPYLVACRVALRRLEKLGKRQVTSPRQAPSSSVIPLVGSALVESLRRRIAAGHGEGSPPDPNRTRDNVRRKRPRR